MKNAFALMGNVCASVVLGGGLMAGVLLAANGNEIRVTLPHDVTAGIVVLPAGAYTISPYEMGGEEYFVVRGEKGKVAVLPAQETGEDVSKTQITFTTEGNVWHFDKLSVAGEGSFQFTTK